MGTQEIIDHIKFLNKRVVDLEHNNMILISRFNHINNKKIHLDKKIFDKYLQRCKRKLDVNPLLSTKMHNVVIARQILSYILFENYTRESIALRLDVHPSSITLGVQNTYEGLLSKNPEFVSKYKMLVI